MPKFELTIETIQKWANDTPSDYARYAYEMYGEARLWRAHDGKPMPKWDDVNEEIKYAWMQAVGQAIAGYKRSLQAQRMIDSLKECGWL